MPVYIPIHHVMDVEYGNKALLLLLLLLYRSLEISPRQRQSKLKGINFVISKYK